VCFCPFRTRFSGSVTLASERRSPSAGACSENDLASVRTTMNQEAAEQCIGASKSAMAAGDWDKAIRMLDKAIRLNPQNSVRSSVPRRFRQPAAASILMLTRQACARQAEAQVLKMKATAVRQFPSYAADASGADAPGFTGLELCLTAVADCVLQGKASSSTAGKPVRPAAAPSPAPSPGPAAKNYTPEQVRYYHHTLAHSPPFLAAPPAHCRMCPCMCPVATGPASPRYHSFGEGLLQDPRRAKKLRRFDAEKGVPQSTLHHAWPVLSAPLSVNCRASSRASAVP
jgi:hypothetical protein